MKKRMTLATVWLGGCSGCHMSLLDLDERFLALGESAELVYSPLMDVKSFPEQVDITLIEGAVAMDGQATFLRSIRQATTTLVSLGDCAVSGNITALRNMHGRDTVLLDAYGSKGMRMGEDPASPVPRLSDRVTPLHRFIDVDVYLPGCPPHPDLIWHVLQEVLSGRVPVLTEHQLRYG